VNEEETKEPDLYDCRTRPWYTAAATSPKNLIILQDVSGSMTGMRRRIAKAVVNTILDTLTENDYVNVFNFSDLTHALVGCFNKSGTPTLVQVGIYVLWLRMLASKINAIVLNRMLFTGKSGEYSGVQDCNGSEANTGNSQLYLSF